jgi:flagellum-specific ATP synthase
LQQKGFAMTAPDVFGGLRAEIGAIAPREHRGRVGAIARGLIEVAGLSRVATLGDRVMVEGRGGGQRGGEVIGLANGGLTVLPDAGLDGLAIGDPVLLCGETGIAPDDAWIGRVIDPFGRPLDGRPLFRGPVARDLRAPPVPAARRRRLGARLETGLRVFNTLLPIVRGQRVGLFSGSGVGKSSLLGALARGIEADVVVVALIGERGRELREFTEQVLGPAGMARAVVVAATSDMSALVRRRCAATAMLVAEHFRDRGRHVLLLADSITRFAEAHREVALAAGEPASLQGWPPSLARQIMQLAERAGPGPEGAGDITAVLTVLVPGSDMEEPVADILRGVLDGHVVLDRKIAERGRHPAIDVTRSVSRALPQAATAAENALIAEARQRLGAYDRAQLMIQTGLYARGSDAAVDAAVRVWPALDAFIAEAEPEDTAASFRRLAQCLRGGGEG